MPKLHQRHKRKNRSSAVRHGGARAIGDLLSGRLPALSGIGDRSARQARWRSWLEAHLPAGLAGHITGIVEDNGMLTVLAESAAWSARLRFALAELDAPLRAAHPNIERVAVKVQPVGSAGASM